MGSLSRDDASVVDGTRNYNDPQFWQLASIHGVDYLMYHRLKERGLIDGVELSDVALEIRENLLNNLEIVSRLQEILLEMQQSQLRVFCFKGPVIAVMAHGGLSYRGAGDIDLLIDRSELDKAVRVLSRLGFESTEELRGRAYREFHFHLPFLDKNGIEVEVHWAISRESCRVAFDLDRMWRRRVQFPIQGEPHDVLSPEDHLLILCVHGTRHLWERLIWVCDVEAIVRRFPDLDWEYVQQESKRLGCARMVLLALFLVNHLFREPVPIELLRQAYAEPSVLAISRSIIARYDDCDSEEELGAFQRDWACLLLRERWQDKMRFFWSLPLSEYCDLWEEQEREREAGELQPDCDVGSVGRKAVFSVFKRTLIRGRKIAKKCGMASPS